MKVSSGRLGQYTLLNAETSLSSYLVETVLFSRETFEIFVEKYETFIIKPVFGPNTIRIIKNKQHILVNSMTTSTVCISNEEAYNHLIYYELTEKYYILQESVHRKFDHLLLTVHRNSTSQWTISKRTEKRSSLLSRLNAYVLRGKIDLVAIQVASVLGQSFTNAHTIVVEIAMDLKGNLVVIDTVLHFQKSKWSQYNTLMTSRFLMPHMPQTDLLTKKTFVQFSRKYKEIILKPANGKEGRGIVRILKMMDGSYIMHIGKKKIKKNNCRETYKLLQEVYLLQDYYLIQQCLPLATIDSCPVDIRVIMQSISSDWKATGKIVKVASKDYFITNAAQQLLPFEIAIQKSTVLDKNVKQIEKEIDAICLVATKKLETEHEQMKIIGFDIGLANDGKLWIIEGNFNPDLSMFSMLKDRSIFMKILTYKRGKR